MPSFNIIYLLQKLQELFGAHPVKPAGIVEQAQIWFQYAEWAALLAAILLLVAFIVLKLLYLGSEHAIEHRRLHDELALHESVHAQAAVKPEASRFSTIEHMAGSENENDRRQAIIDADAMLAELLNSHGFVGADMGEQLRNASTAHFATRDAATAAHGMRNRIAHLGSGFSVSTRDAQEAISAYRRVFDEFNYI